MKRWFVILGSFWMVWGAFSLGEAVVDRILAVVDQEIITLSEVDLHMGPLLGTIQAGNRLEREAKLRELRRKVLDRLIDEKVLDHEAKKSGVRITSKEVDAVVEDIKRRNQATEEDLEKALQKDGTTLEAYRQTIERTLVRSKLVRWNVKMEAKSDEQSLRNFYEKNIDRYRAGESFHPAHILLTVPSGATEGEVQEIRRKCQQILDRIKKGADFGEMALLYSQDSSARFGGDLGYFKRGEIVPVLEQAIVHLKVGEVSGIVRTDFGFHILKLLDRKEGVPSPFESVKEKVYEDYNTQEWDKAVQAYISSLKKASVIEIRL
jgi:peptidyl-prolyl cis-trans isomerase SurA